MNTEEMLEDLERRYKVYRNKKDEVKQRLEKEIEDKKARGWNDITITIDDLEVLLNNKK